MSSSSRMMTGEIPYLARDTLYKTEKPYLADFRLDGIAGAEYTNIIYDRQNMPIYDIRDLQEDLNLDLNGFCCLKYATKLRNEDISNDPTPAMKLFLAEIESMLYTSFPEYTRIEIMDFIVRKRSPAFPKSFGTDVEFAQPAGVPHTDFSPRGAYMRMGTAFPSQEQSYKHRQFEMINVWRVLKGPNNDWPLAICDARTVDFEGDCAASDAVHENDIGENFILHANPAHKWYYLSDQMEDELFVFRNSDSTGQRPSAFHCAFENLESMSPPRESIEVRTVAFRD